MTWRSPEETALLARFSSQYQHGQAHVMRDIERNVCGCDYGGTSWTTRHEAERVGQLLELRAGKRLLDLGAGSGWPGLYLARTTGCDVTLVDIPLEGLRIAARRAIADAVSGKAWAVASDGAQLPFHDEAFDAIGHSDVLCCLEMKLAVLHECRRVIRNRGTMVFSVISIEPSLSPEDHQRAVTAGPPFKAVSSDYPGMLAQTGWRMLWRLDLTDDYQVAVQQRLREEELHTDALVDVLGETDLAETIARRRRTADAIKDSLICRELFAVVPAE